MKRHFVTSVISLITLVMMFFPDNMALILTELEPNNNTENYFLTNAINSPELRNNQTSENEENKNGFVNLCFDLIKNGEYHGALSVYQKTNDDGQLALIVKMSYDGNVKSLQHILQFTTLLPTKSERTLALISLHEAMKVLEDLENVKVLIFYCMVSKGGYTSVVNLLETYRKNFITKLANEIEQGEYKHALDFNRKYPVIFNDHLQLLIEAAYGSNTVYIGKTLEFIRALNSTSEKGAGYKYLYEIMKNRNELNSSMFVDLSCFVKDDFDESNVDFKSLKEELPSGLKSVIWSNYVHIESREYQGYTLYGSNPGNIYTYPSDNYKGGKNQKWQVEKEVVEGSCYFRFNNVQNSLVLHNGGKYAKNCKRIVGVGKERDKQFWELVPVKGKFVSIRDKAVGKWLDAGQLVRCASSRLCCCTRVLMSAKHVGDKRIWTVY